MSECWYFFLIFDHLFQIIQDIWHKSDNLGEIWQNLIQRLNHRQVPIELSLSMGARTNLISSWINRSSLFLVLLSPPLVVAVVTNMSYALRKLFAITENKTGHPKLKRQALFKDDEMSTNFCLNHLPSLCNNDDVIYKKKRWFLN